MSEQQTLEPKCICPEGSKGYDLHCRACHPDTPTSNPRALIENLWGYVTSTSDRMGFSKALQAIELELTRDKCEIERLQRELAGFKPMTTEELRAHARAAVETPAERHFAFAILEDEKPWFSESCLFDTLADALEEVDSLTDGGRESPESFKAVELFYRTAEKSTEHTRHEVMNPPESAAEGSEARNLTSANVMGLGQVHRAAEARPAEAAPLPEKSSGRMEQALATAIEDPEARKVFDETVARERERQAATDRSSKISEPLFNAETGNCEHGIPRRFCTAVHDSPQLRERSSTRIDGVGELE